MSILCSAKATHGYTTLRGYEVIALSEKKNENLNRSHTITHITLKKVVSRKELYVGPNIVKYCNSKGSIRCSRLTNKFIPRVPMMCVYIGRQSCFRGQIQNICSKTWHTIWLIKRRHIVHFLKRYLLEHFH